jgi:hypothetical protein
MAWNSANAGVYYTGTLNGSLFALGEGEVLEWGFGQVLAVLTWTPLAVLFLEEFWCK